MDENEEERNDSRVSVGRTFFAIFIFSVSAINFLSFLCAPTKINNPHTHTHTVMFEP
jgi:hypothetical protein